MRKVRSQRERGMRRGAKVFLLSLVGGAGLCASPASAHFVLTTPSSQSAQDTFGNPQKAVPCGLDAASPGTPTGAVTTYKAGDTITLTIKETIFHPGHYRVAIAQNPQSLPADPPVTPEVTPNNTPCGSVPIDLNPKPPILADGIFKHTVSYGATPQTVQIKLPAGFTCTNCTLQVIQWMYNHVLNVPGGCFYHHCANVNIVADTDGGVTPVADMSMPTPDLTPTNPPPPGGMEPGCACAVGGSSTGLPMAPMGVAAILLGLLWHRRVRRSA